MIDCKLKIVKNKKIAKNNSYIRKCYQKESLNQFDSNVYLVIIFRMKVFYFLLNNSE